MCPIRLIILEDGEAVMAEDMPNIDENFDGDIEGLVTCSPGAYLGTIGLNDTEVPTPTLWSWSHSPAWAQVQVTACHSAPCSVSHSTVTYCSVHIYGCHTILYYSTYHSTPETAMN